jgi:dipeptidyl aminopeptidase/acylaminoacyl peptidase
MKSRSIRTHAAVLVALIYALSASANPSIDDFTREPDLRDAQLSPDGKHLAMIITEGHERWVTVRNLETPEMPLVGAFTDTLIRPSSLYWGNNDRLLIAMDVPYEPKKVERDMSREDFDFNEYFMLSRMVAVDKDIRNLVVLFEGERTLERNISLSRVTNFLPDKPDHVLMAAYRNDRRVQYEVNIVTGEAEINAKGSPRTYKFLNSRDGAPKYRFDYRSRARAIEIFRYNAEESWERVDKLYLSQDDEDSIETNGLLAMYENDLVYRKRSEETGFYDLVVVDRESRESRTMVSLPDQDVRGIVINSRTDAIIGYAVEKDVERFVYFDEEKQKRYDAISVQVGNSNFSVSGLTSGSTRALIKMWGPDDPGTYHLWDFETEQLTFLGHAYHGIATANLSTSALTTYKAGDGQPIRAYILLPPGFEQGKEYPTIVMPHGGPHARSRLSYDDFAQFLSTRGYIVVEPNFRGSTGYGYDFERAGYKQWGGVMQDDLTDALEFMVRKGYTDPEKVCIVGTSYGGYAALMGAIKTPALYKCAISLNGVTHLEKLIRYNMKEVVDKAEWDVALFDRIGHPEKDKELLDANSPALHADKITIPVMIVAGSADNVVPYSQAKLMVKALEKAGAKFEFIRLKDTGHNPFYYVEDMELVFEAVEKFLDSHLR